MPGEPATEGLGEERPGTEPEPVDSEPAPGLVRPHADGAKRRIRRRKRTPEQMREDNDAFWGEFADSSADDRWLQEQRPPHWD
jgi:hypothetical protein